VSRAFDRIVERRSGADEPRHVGDVHPRADPVRLTAERQCVVEVLRRFRIDRVGQKVAKIGAGGILGLRSLVRLEGLPRAPLDEQSAEHVLDPVGRSEQLVHLGAAAAGPHDGEVAGRHVADALRLEDDGNAGREIRIADDQPPAAANFDDQP
jgi:hypothetical protein